jgi:hypothetical protein
MRAARRPLRRHVRFLVGLGIGLAPKMLAAQNSEVVRGRVVDTQRKPVVDVDITVTGQTAGVVQHSHTDAKGVWSVLFRDAEGSYVVGFRKLGYGSYTRTVRQVGLSNIIDVADVVLAGGVNVLQPLVATRMLKVPSRGEIPSVGSTELNTTGNALFTLDPGDLNALAALLPGATATGDSGYSVLGAPPSQNKVLIDGMDFDGASLPRDAISRTKVVTNTFDPSKGAFSGAETVVTTRQGSDFFASTIRAQLVDPHLAWADPDAPTPVPQTGYASGYVTGPIVPKKLDFIAAFDLSDRVTDQPSLLEPRATLLSQLGVSADSVAAARHGLATLGVPPTVSAVPGSPARFSGSATVRLDYRLHPNTSITFSAIGDFNHASGVGISELAFPSASSAVRNTTIRYKLSGGTYFNRVLDEFSTGVTPSSSMQTPYLAEPTGSVLVGTTYADGRAGLTALRFGGTGSAGSRSSSNTWDTENELSWSTPDTHHQIKFTQELRFDWGSSLQNSNQFGAYGYQSLADLAANTPASFTRTLSAVSLANRATVAALSLGDVWHLVPGKFDLQGGVRFDSRTFGVQPAYNPQVDSLFGVRTDHLPSDVGLTPRLGFSWRPKARPNGALPDGMTIIMPNGSGGARGSRAPLDAAGIALLAPGNDFTVSGGIGAYRGTIASDRVGALTGETGLPSTTQYLSCVGAAVPTPAWSGGAQPITACADGSGAEGFSATQPRVTVFTPGFRAPISWRGNLQLTGWRLHNWAIAPQVTWSTGLNAESWVDLNLQRTPRFTLMDEGNRPVYAAPSTIDPSSGLFAPTASRVASRYGVVRDVVADLQYHAAQLTIAVAPPNPLFGRVPIYLVYALSNQRREQRGFTGTTNGDPFATEWVSGNQPTHQFILGASNIKLWWFTVGARVNVLSGVPYTPVVANDVNGDGLANDRAFVANPTTTGDAALASEMTALLAAAPTAAAACLRAQLGAVAGANSCRTPWQARLDLNVAFTPPQSLGVGSRLRVTTTLLNVSGALVRLFGLENTPLGQSAASSNVDPRLLYVTGFDPAAQRFTYHVNQLFGEPIDYGTARRIYPPFELQIGLEYRLGYPPTAQTARSVGVFPNGRDSASMAATVRQELLRRTVGNPATPILAYRDSLALTPDQVAGIEAISQLFVRRFDSLTAPVIAYVIKRGKKLTSDDYNARMSTVYPSLRDLATVTAQQAKAFLLPEQRAKLDVLTLSRR